MSTEVTRRVLPVERTVLELNLAEMSSGAKRAGRPALTGTMSARITKKEKRSLLTSLLNFFRSRKKEELSAPDPDTRPSAKQLDESPRSVSAARTSRRLSESSSEFQNSFKSSVVSMSSRHMGHISTLLEEEDSEAVDDDDEASDGSSDIGEYEGVQVSEISWSEISLPELATSDLILGKGSFGTVIRAVWRHQNCDREVAIKVQTRSFQPSRQHRRAFKKVRRRARKEAGMMVLVRQKVNSNVITDAYGIIDGPLPDSVANLLRKCAGEASVGIVMKFEGGGSLEKMILSSSRRVNKIYPIHEKLRLLALVAKGLVD
jgi:hypothetical protein